MLSSADVAAGNKASPADAFAACTSLTRVFNPTQLKAEPPASASSLLSPDASTTSPKQRRCHLVTSVRVHVGRDARTSIRRTLGNEPRQDDKPRRQGGSRGCAAAASGTSESACPLLRHVTPRVHCVCVPQPTYGSPVTQGRCPV